VQRHEPRWVLEKIELYEDGGGRAHHGTRHGGKVYVVNIIIGLA
jgi:hypothetical protein